MSEPCISKSAHNYNYFLHDTKEELQLYGTATSNSKQAVKRNLKRFPPDFMFQLTNEETAMQLELINQSLGKHPRNVTETE